MPRKPLPQQEYIIQRQEHGPSKSAKTLNEQMVTIFFRGSVDKRNYVTYIVESFRNIKQWEDILLRPHEKLRIQFDPGWISYGNTIDADSRPFIIGDSQGVSAKEIFEFASEHDKEKQEQIDLVKAGIQMYRENGSAQEVIEKLERRLVELQSMGLETAFVKPSITKMFSMPVDECDFPLLDDPERHQRILAQICQWDPLALEMIQTAQRFEIVDVIDLFDQYMNTSHITALVAIWFTPEDEVMFKLRGDLEVI